MQRAGNKDDSGGVPEPTSRALIDLFETGICCVRNQIYVRCDSARAERRVEKRAALWERLDDDVQAAVVVTQHSQGEGGHPV